MSWRQTLSGSEVRLPGKFRDCLCAHQKARASDYERLVWQHGTTLQTKLIAPLARWLWRDFFKPEDDCIIAIADCRWRSHVRNEVLLLRSGMRRRSWLRFFGIGLSGRRIMRLYDELALAGVAQTGLSSHSKAAGPGGIQR